MGIVPLKRFTTEVYESIYKRSTFHNQQLEELLTVLTVSYTHLLDIISQNARIPFKDVAAECGVSRAAIHQRCLLYTSRCV